MHIHTLAAGPAGALLRLMLRVPVLIVLTLLVAPPLGAQQGAPEGTAPTDPTGGIGAAGADTDPTKPVLYSLRNEYFDLGDGGWQNLLILRADRLFLERHALVGNARGVITRVDVPLAWVDRGDGSEGGLGDVYLQALALPRLAPRFVLACGVGLSAPTATDEVLGLGKWVAAPAVAPVWFFPGKGLAFVKVQDWLSFAGGSDRDDVHFLTVTPTLLWRLSPRWWTVLSAESRTDWQRDAATSVRSSVQLGFMFSPRIGTSLTVDVYSGDRPRPEYGVRAVVFRTRF